MPNNLNVSSARTNTNDGSQAQAMAYVITHRVVLMYSYGAGSSFTVSFGELAKRIKPARY